MRLTFVVKGKGKAINAELVARGIQCRLIATGKDFSTFEAYPEDLEKLVIWYCEERELVLGRGYPDGTLLIYSCHEEQECRLLERETK